MTLDSDIKSGNISRRQFLALMGAGTAAVVAPGLVLPKRAEASTNLRVVDGFVGVPGETYMIPTNETVDWFINGAKTVGEVLGDLEQDMYKITHKNIGQTNDIKNKFLGKQPAMVFIAGEKGGNSTAGFFKTLAMSFPEMAKLYVDCDVHGKFSQDMSSIMSYHHFKNKRTPAVVFFDSSGKLMKDHQHGLFDKLPEFYRFIDGYLPFIAQNVLGKKYVDKGYSRIHPTDAHAMGTPINDKGYPINTRLIPRGKRGFKGKDRTRVGVPKGTLMVKYDPGEFTDDFTSPAHHQHIANALTAHGISPQGMMKLIKDNKTRYQTTLFDSGELAYFGKKGMYLVKGLPGMAKAVDRSYV